MHLSNEAKEFRDAYGLSNKAARAMSGLQRHEAGRFGPTRRLTTPQDSYPFIALPPHQSKGIINAGISHFRRTRGRNPRTFLEIGCGFGGITHWVQTQRKLQATGIDISPAYIKLCKLHLQGEFRVADALKFRNFSKFDIIYFYQPFYATAMSRKFNNRLARLCGDAVVCPNYALHDTLLSPCTLKGVWDRWETITMRVDKRNVAHLAFIKTDYRGKQLTVGGHLRF